MEYNNDIKITMSNNTEAIDALSGIKSLLLQGNYESGYRYHPSERMGNALKVKGSEIIYDCGDGFFTPEDINQIAEDIATYLFNCYDGFKNLYFYTSSTYADAETKTEITGNSMKITHTYWPCGYSEALFCDQCGEQFMLFRNYNGETTTTCLICGEEINVAAIYDEVSPETITTIINKKEN